MSGGVEVLTDVVLPWSRIVIIGFGFRRAPRGCGLLLARTRLGLYVRAVTQIRAMASCVGVPNRTRGRLAFGLGSGIGGTRGCALCRSATSRPISGQSYIVDSFLVVVFGGLASSAAPCRRAHTRPG